VLQSARALKGVVGKTSRYTRRVLSGWADEVHCTALHCTLRDEVNCTALHCTLRVLSGWADEPQRKQLSPTGGCSGVHWRTALHCTALHCTVLHCTALDTVHCTAQSVRPVQRSALEDPINQGCSSMCSAVQCSAVQCSAFFFS
jgi:hypothetical protein